MNHLRCHDHTIRVTRSGRICFDSRKINFSNVFSGQLVGIREVDDQVWQVSFMAYDLGFFDKEQDRVEPGPDPFTPDTRLTMCPEKGVNHVIGMHLSLLVVMGGIEPPTYGL